MQRTTTAEIVVRSCKKTPCGCFFVVHTKAFIGKIDFTHVGNGSLYCIKVLKIADDGNKKCKNCFTKTLYKMRLVWYINFVTETLSGDFSGADAVLGKFM